MKNIILLLSLVLLPLPVILAQGLLIEAESFSHKGGWVTDPQFTEEMGSPYLLAHGLGKPVENAFTTVGIPRAGRYHVWVRTKNWAPGNWKAPGAFLLRINGTLVADTLGTLPGWRWQNAGTVKLKGKTVKLELEDLTGFDGRCDAILLTRRCGAPPDTGTALKTWRSTMLGESPGPEKTMHFDLVIVGGGLAGCAASIAAARQGLNVALIHDRPVLGGNASSEVRVHTLGIYGYFEQILKLLDTEHYPNGSPEALKDEQKRMTNMASFPGIHLFLNWRAYAANTVNDRIVSVDARQTSDSGRIRFTAPLFVDATGDGWIGYWAGAKYMYGRESAETYGEGYPEYGNLWSPEKPDGRVMGASVLWRSYDAGEARSFPEVPWAVAVAGNYAAANGEWQWEYSTDSLNQAMDSEAIRDHLLRAVYGSFSNEKQKPGGENLSLEWVSFLAGKRESRRLEGDYVFTFADVVNHRHFPDAVVMEDREVDVHYQDVLTDTTRPDFLSTALYYRTERYEVPYRCLYSRNIGNLFMAGRCFSCSHVGLGGPRVMRTTGQMGAAVGYAASICHKHGDLPRDVYTTHLREYMQLVTGGKAGVPGSAQPTIKKYEP